MEDPVHGAGPLHTARVLLLYYRGSYKHDAERHRLYLRLSHALTLVSNAHGDDRIQDTVPQKNQFFFGTALVMESYGVSLSLFDQTRRVNVSRGDAMRLC